MHHESTSEGATDDYRIRPIRSTFVDPAVERAYLDSRRVDDVRAAAGAAILGGVAYATACMSDFAVFSGPATPQLSTVLTLRAIGVLLCFSSAFVMLHWRTHAVVNAISSLCILGTLTTYAVIAGIEEATVGPSDYRIVFPVFALLAFIFFPVPVSFSIGILCGMVADMLVLSHVAERVTVTDAQRTFALMLTFGVAGGLFSVRNNRSRRKEYALSARLARTNARLSNEIEKRRATDEELQQHKEHLEELVQIRTEQLQSTERRLVASQRMESIGQLSGGLAHDFNNLLLVILANADLTLAHEGLPDAAKRHQRDILAAGTRAADLARDLLTFSRRQIMEFAPVSLTDVMSRMQNILSSVVSAGVQLKVDLDDGLETIRGARGPLEQVIVNLVLNARDAIGATGTIELTTQNVWVDADLTSENLHAEEGSYVLLTVSDSGPGMPAEVRERIFEPFYSTKEAGKGTGLGLSVVHGIVRQHGGFIRVVSEPGNGTQFFVYFPTTDGPAEALTEPKKVASTRGTETILVVDDEELVLKLVSQVLQGAGYSVVETSSGEEALDELRSHEKGIDLVLTDVVMPGMGGRELMTQIKRLDPALPILFSSGYSVGGIHTKFALDEGLELIAKPYQPEELINKVRRILDCKPRDPKGRATTNLPTS